MGTQRNQIRIDQTRGELDRLRTEIAEWLELRRERDERLQYSTQLDNLQTFFDQVLAALRGQVDGIELGAQSRNETMLTELDNYPAPAVRLELMAQLATALGQDGQAALSGLDPAALTTGEPLEDDEGYDLCLEARAHLDLVPALVQAIDGFPFEGLGSFKGLSGRRMRVRSGTGPTGCARENPWVARNASTTRASSPAPGSPPGPKSAAWPMPGSDQRPPPFVYSTEPEVEVYAAEVNLLPPYAESARSLDAGLVEALGEPSHLLGRQSVPVDLRVDGRLAPYPWEALLSLAMPDGLPDPHREPQRYYRTGGRPYGEPPRWHGGLHVVANDTWSGLLELGWQSTSAGPTVDQGLYSLKGSVPLKVLHLAGRPIQTSAGLRLQVGQGAFEQSINFRQDTIKRGGDLIAADSLPLGQVWLAVIQADPVEGLVHNEASREDAAYLRALAAEMLESGSQAVLTLPAMPPELVRQVVAQLATEFLAEMPPDRQRMLKTVCGLRGEIVGWLATVLELESGIGQPRSDEELTAMLIEMAFDVCLYWRASEIAKAGRDAFMDALDIMDEAEAKKAMKQARRAINIAIRRSPDIAKYDKTRAWANIKAGLDEIEAEVGFGGMDVKCGSVTDLINSGPMTIQQAVGMGEPVLE